MESQIFTFIISALSKEMYSVLFSCTIQVVTEYFKLYCIVLFQVLATAGLGSIVRVLTDRKTV